MNDIDELTTFRLFARDRLVVIWGLRNFSHTHAYIHANYFKVLRRNDINVIWLDDHHQNRKLVPQNAIVICVNLAITWLPLHNDITYLAHNMEENQKALLSEYNVLFYENYKRTSIGIPHESAAMAIFSPAERLLAQPYGTPIPRRQWLTADSFPNQKMRETWVGSIWNDAQNRGNELVIESYVTALHAHGISFRHVEFGKFAKLSISLALEKRFISASVFGASIHSYHQISESNIVCRFFKSISYGKVPTTNQIHAEAFFPDSIVAQLDLSLLLEQRLQLSNIEVSRKLKLAQEQLKPYTYEAGFNRMVLAINNDWS